MAELPSDSDLREVVDTVVGACSGTTLIAKHETERPVKSDTGFREHLSGWLPDQQTTVLQIIPQRLFRVAPRDRRGTRRLTGCLHTDAPQSSREGLVEAPDRVLRQGMGNTFKGNESVNLISLFR